MAMAPTPIPLTSPATTVRALNGVTACTAEISGKHKAQAQRGPTRTQTVPAMPSCDEDIAVGFIGDIHVA